MKSPSGQRRLILGGVKSLVFGAAGRLGNLVFMLYPEQIGYYQEWPLGVARTLQRGNVYGLPDDRREMRLARYLAMRIDREATREDHQLIVWSCEAKPGFANIMIICAGSYRSTNYKKNPCRERRPHSTTSF
jgi:hypothetical protein